MPKDERSKAIDAAIDELQAVDPSTNVISKEDFKVSGGDVGGLLLSRRSGGTEFVFPFRFFLCLGF